MKNRIIHMLVTVLMVCILHNCGVGPVGDTGGASETIAIMVTDTVLSGRATRISADSVGIANTDVIVSAYALDYLPFMTRSANNFTISSAADVQGEFRCDLRGAGYYNVYVKDTHTGKSLFIDSIPVSQGSRDTIYDTLSYGGSMRGTVYFVDSSRADTSGAFNYYVFITGSPFVTRTDPLGTFFLDTLPEARYTIKTLSSASLDSLVNSFDILQNMINRIPGEAVSIQEGEALEGILIYSVGYK